MPKDPKPGQPPRDDDDLPLLYPEEDGPESEPIEQLYDPFADDAKAHDKGRERPSGPRQRAGAEKLQELLNFGAGRQQSDPLPLEPLDATVSPPPRAPADPGSASVFEPVASKASPRSSPPPPPSQRPRATRRKRGGAGTVPPEEDSVFQPRRGGGKAAPKPVDDAMPESPREIPRVKPRYDRVHELGPVVGMAAVLLVLGIVAAILGKWFGVLMIFAGLLCTGYRLCIILPHPVRVTPEQGVREFYEAFCHFVPNFRRMYLLLSVPAKEAAEVGDSYRAFCAYWRWRQLQLLGKRSMFNGFGFQIERFESTYNSQRTFAKVEYTLIFHPRGRPQQHLLVRPISSTMVKGPDGSWYLNEGTLP